MNSILIFCCVLLSEMQLNAEKTNLLVHSKHSLSSLFEEKSNNGLLPRTQSLLEKPIFVIGCPRSGTTLLGSCLQNHSKLGGGEESLFIIDLWRVFSDLHMGINKRNFRPLSSYLSAQELLDLIGSFSDHIFHGQLKSGELYYVDHTPWYALIMPFLDLLYPDAIFIHVIRNGQDVVNSLTVSNEKGFSWAGDSFEKRVQLWMDIVETSRQFGACLPSCRYQEIRYENLCLDPESTLKAVVHSVGLDWDEKCLEPLAMAHAGPSNLNSVIGVYDENGHLKFNHFLKKNYQSPPNWSAEDCKIFDKKAAQLMKSLGYIKDGS